MKPILAFVMLLGTMVGQTTKPAEPLITLTRPTGVRVWTTTLPVSSADPQKQAACLGDTDEQLRRACIFEAELGCTVTFTVGVDGKYDGNVMKWNNCAVPARIPRIVYDDEYRPNGLLGVFPPICGTKEAVGQPVCAVGEPNIYMPADVPAITKKHKLRYKGDHFPCGVPEDCIATEDMFENIPTCADKTRILMHDGETPPKYWCHRVETK